MLEHGANPNAKYFFGREINLLNPFNTEAMSLLLSHGADPNARDRQSFTPIMKACRLTQVGLIAEIICINVFMNKRSTVRCFITIYTLAAISTLRWVAMFVITTRFMQRASLWQV